MTSCPATSTIARVRRFNRFYTRILGLLDRHILDSPFSLTEARVLFEIANTRGCTATKLIELLEIDPGYLSRMLKKFEKQNLIFKEKSASDGRFHFLHLTRKGRDVLAKLNESADRQIAKLIGSLSGDRQAALVKSMARIEAVLSDQPDSSIDSSVTIRTHRPGDIGYVAYRHGVLYAKEYGFDLTFDYYVARGLVEFLENYDSVTDRLWLAEYDGQIVGSIAIVGRGGNTAQLRWFLVEPGFRGRGVGRRLMAEAINFYRERQFAKVFLWTFDALHAARHLYQSFGFQLTDRKEHDVWGRHLVEERWDLDLGRA